MRLWSLHPKHLDAKGLVAVWREGLLAQSVLRGATQGYRNHPQLIRFKELNEPRAAIGTYLYHIHQESLRRNYNFDLKKIANTGFEETIILTSGQLEFEWYHLLAKLKLRELSLYGKLQSLKGPEVHPIFHLEKGKVAAWELGTLVKQNIANGQ